MELDVLLLGILFKKINENLSGISNVSYDSTGNKLIFTNATTGQTFDVPLPTTYHEHLNSAILDKLDVDANGALTLDGIPVASDLTPIEVTEIKNIINNITTDADGDVIVNGVEIKKDSTTGDYTLNGNTVVMSDQAMTDADANDMFNDIFN